MKVLVTCPPMIGIRSQLDEVFAAKNLEPEYADVVQTLSEQQLKALLPEFDGWIIGDDPASRSVFEAGKAGRLKAAIKWGVGVDNVDFDACHDLDIPVSNTPGMFGQEVADIAIGYLIGLARHTFRIDREVRQGGWPKHRGVSLAGKRVALVGCGDIGFQVLRRLDVMGCYSLVFDPFVDDARLSGFSCELSQWPMQLDSCDFLILTCALTKATEKMLDAEVLAGVGTGLKVINVSRGGLIDQEALIIALESGKVGGAALDVFESEPLADERLRHRDDCILGTHNASNTQDAVYRTSLLAIDKLSGALSK